MRKKVAFLMAAVLLISCFAFPVFAEEPVEEITTAPQVGDPIYFADGSYIIIEPVTPSLTRGYVMGYEKAARVFDSDNKETCRLTLTAKFLVNDNNTITCISSLYKTDVYVSGWALEEPASTCSDHGTYSVATATATARKRLLGITTKYIPLTVTITGYTNGTAV